jgi:hypothetical protein
MVAMSLAGLAGLAWLGWALVNLSSIVRRHERVRVVDTALLGIILSLVVAYVWLAWLD